MKKLPLNHTIFHFSSFLLELFLIAFLNGCKKEYQAEIYNVSGSISHATGQPLSGIKLYYSESEFIVSDAVGSFDFKGLPQNTTIFIKNTDYLFQPNEILVTTDLLNQKITAETIPTTIDSKIFSWIKSQQLSNGLVPSSEGGSLISLYDNALAALVFMLNEDYVSAEMIFDFFNNRIQTELKNGPGGFSQFRNASGEPNNHRWLGDNAWLLIALNNYKAQTGNTTYDELRSELSSWIKSLQDTDGGLWSGYNSSGELLNYKVSEGMIDSYNAISGFDDFHQKLLSYLEENRWDVAQGALVAWPENPPFLYALDVNTWSYCAFEDMPTSTLEAFDKYRNTQTISHNQVQIEGYCFDEDRDVVWLEGTAQVALAYFVAGNSNMANEILREMDKSFLESASKTDEGGFCYSANQGTSYGGDLLWESADKEIAVSSGAWYLFARYGFNPFEVEKNKPNSAEFVFWK